MGVKRLRIKDGDREGDGKDIKEERDRKKRKRDQIGNKKPK